MGSLTCTHRLVLGGHFEWPLLYLVQCQWVKAWGVGGGGTTRESGRGCERVWRGCEKCCCRVEGWLGW